MQDIKLQSAYDDRIIPITPAVARLSKFIRDMLEAKACGYNIYPANKKEIAIKVDTRGENLEKIIEWCEHHKDDSISQEKEEKKDLWGRWTKDMPLWDVEFFEVNVPALMELKGAANKLKITVMKNYASEVHMHLNFISMGPKKLRQILNDNPLELVHDADAA